MKSKTARVIEIVGAILTWLMIILGMLIGSTILGTAIGSTLFGCASPAFVGPPVDTSYAPIETVQQVGAVPIAADVQEVSWLGGLNVQQTLPLSLAVIIIVIVVFLPWLSHRREMKRLTQNGKSGAITVHAGASSPVNVNRSTSPWKNS